MYHESCENLKATAFDPLECCGPFIAPLICKTTRFSPQFNCHGPNWRRRSIAVGRTTSLGWPVEPHRNRRSRRNRWRYVIDTVTGSRLCYRFRTNKRTRKCLNDVRRQKNQRHFNRANPESIFSRLDSDAIRIYEFPKKKKGMTNGVQTFQGGK